MERISNISVSKLKEDLIENKVPKRVFVFINVDNRKLS